MCDINKNNIKQTLGPEKTKEKLSTRSPRARNDRSTNLSFSAIVTSTKIYASEKIVYNKKQFKYANVALFSEKFCLFTMRKIW